MKLLPVVVVAFFILGCQKTEVAYEGKVYSKNRVPIPGAEVVFTYKEDTKKKKTGSLNTFTNSDGNFSLHETLNRKVIMEAVSVVHDSGRYESGLSNRRGISDLEIVLR